MRPVPQYGAGRRARAELGATLALALLVGGASTLVAQEVPGDGPAVEQGQASGDTAPEDAALDALAAEVAAELRCPVCRNQSVLESSAELSREMHATIRSRLAAGESPEEVKAYFVDRYGEWILLKPTARGVNLAVYALPALVLLLGAAFLLVRLRDWARRAPTTDPAELGEGEVGTDGQAGVYSSATISKTATPDEAVSSTAGLEELSEADRRWLEDAVRRS
jgi:cytochrome c-type biogenesis protein CcmH